MPLDLVRPLPTGYVPTQWRTIARCGVYISTPARRVWRAFPGHGQPLTGELRHHSEVPTKRRERRRDPVAAMSGCVDPTWRNPRWHKQLRRSYRSATRQFRHAPSISRSPYDAPAIRTWR